MSAEIRRGENSPFKRATLTCAILSADFGMEIWALFEAGGLHVDVELTGRIELDTRPVDLDSVLQELEETRLYEDARVRRQQELSAG